MKVYYALLTKIDSNHSNLRTNEVEGVTGNLPEVGKSFTLAGESLTEGADVRIISTTEIKSVDIKYNTIVFKTKNSTYQLDILDIEDVE